MKPAYRVNDYLTAAEGKQDKGKDFTDHARDKNTTNISGKEKLQHSGKHK